MTSRGIPVLIASTMSECYTERLIMVKDYYSVARRPYLSPSFVAVFKRDSMIGLAKGLSLWFVVRWASWSTNQNIFTYSKQFLVRFPQKQQLSQLLKKQMIPKVKNNICENNTVLIWE